MSSRSSSTSDCCGLVAGAAEGIDKLRPPTIKMNITLQTNVYFEMVALHLYFQIHL